MKSRHFKYARLLTISFTLLGLFLRRLTVCSTTRQGECKKDHITFKRH